MQETEYFERLAHMYWDTHPRAIPWEELDEDSKQNEINYMRRFILASNDFHIQITKEIEDRLPAFCLSQSKHDQPCLECQAQTKLRIIRKSDNTMYPYCQNHIQNALKCLINN